MLSSSHICLLVVENHPVSCQVEPPLLASFELRPILPRKLHGYIVAEEKNALSSMDENPTICMGSVQCHFLQID